MNTIDAFVQHVAALPASFGVWISPDGTVYFLDVHRHFEWLEENYELLGISDAEFEEALGRDKYLGDVAQVAYDLGAVRLGMDAGELYAFTGDLNTAFIAEVQDFIFDYGASGERVSIEGNNGSLVATFDEFLTEKPAKLMRSRR